MRFSYIPLIFLVGLLVGSGCMQSPETADLVKYMTVQTEYDQAVITASANIFNTYSSFTMKVDTVGFVSTLSNDTILTEEDVTNFPKPVTRTVRDRLINKGFTLVAEDGDPDFAVNVVVLQNFSFLQSVNYGGYYPGYGYYGYYGYYYPTVNTYYANYVSLVIQVVDIKNYLANESKYRIIWTAFIGDLNASEDTTTKTLEAIETAFDQSPYITPN